MMWVRLDCTVSSHRKLLRAGAEAAWLWVCGLAHANKHTTNGVIVRDDLVALYPVDGWTPARRRALVAKLVEVGLWEVIDADSWAIHGYAEHQSEAMTEAVEARREYERAKKRSQRDRWKTSVSGGVSRGDTQGDTDGTPTGTPIGTPKGKPMGIPQGVPDSDRPTDRPSSSQSTPNGVLPPQPPDGGATAPTAPKRKSAKADAPPPAPGTPAAAVVAAIADAPRLVGLVSRPNGLAEAALKAFPAVDVIHEIAQADGWCLANPIDAPRSNGDAFLWRWFQREQRAASNRSASQAQRAAAPVADLFAPKPPPAARVVKPGDLNADLDEHVRRMKK